MQPDSKNEIKPVKAWAILDRDNQINPYRCIDEFAAEHQKVVYKPHQIIEVTILPTAELERMREAFSMIASGKWNYDEMVRIAKNQLSISKKGSAL